MWITPVQITITSVCSGWHKCLLFSINTFMIYNLCKAVFCTFRTYWDIPIGHVTNFAGSERCYNVSKFTDVRRETSPLSTSRGDISQNPSIFLFLKIHCAGKSAFQSSISVQFIVTHVTLQIYQSITPFQNKNKKSK